MHNESVIVSEITFGESASGAAIVQGSFVGADQTHARSQGPFRRGGGLESREATISEGWSPGELEVGWADECRKENNLDVGECYEYTGAIFGGGHEVVYTGGCE